MFYLVSTKVGGFMVETESVNKARHYAELVLKVHKINDYRLAAGESDRELLDHFWRCPVCGANRPERQVTVSCFQEPGFLQYKICIKCKLRFTGIVLEN